ncbi:MAG: NTP transferase domain-containing protein [Elusimicrobia bacterium]|nr:NTP transferase domain-containing protein [Elusimicrobiota bacterium]
MKVIASIQARMGASRLPGKVLKDICGKPMLLWQVERLRRCRLLNDILIATTTSAADDRIVEFCKDHAVACYRGPENDVLGRIAGLIREHRPDVHVELFGDSPLPDAELVDEVVSAFLKDSRALDCLTNSRKTTYPPGQEVIVYAAAALLEADRLTAADDPLREHSSFNVLRRPEVFRIRDLEAPPRYRHPDVYLEVDTPEDLELIRAVVGHFAALGQGYFSLAQILDFLRERPELARINARVPRRWKAFRKDG